MKLIQTNIFGEALAPKTFSELVSHVSTPHAKWMDCTWMWRGQSNIDWPIHSSAYRRLTQNNGSTNDGELSRYEQNLLSQATHKGYRNSGGAALTDIELLARLQHHGAATRLVDFTRSMLIALWFACISNPKKSGLLIGFHTAYIRGYEGKVETRTYNEIIEALGTDDCSTTWEPTSVSNRIAAQHSQFLYSRVATNISGSLLLPQKPQESLKVIAIAPKLKSEALTILEQLFDIRHHTLFPDIDGFSTANSHNMPSSYMFRW